MKQFIKGNGGLLFTTITFSLLANIALVLTSKQSEWLFDALSAKDIGYIFIIGGLFYIYLVCSRKLIKKVIAKLREKGFSGIMQKDMKTYYWQNTSEYISVLTNDINLLEENWMKPMLGVCERSECLQYDEIIYMHSGRIVEQGSFAELMAAKGAFYEFYTIVD